MSFCPHICQIKKRCRTSVCYIHNNQTKQERTKMPSFSDVVEQRCVVTSCLFCWLGILLGKPNGLICPDYFSHDFFLDIGCFSIQFRLEKSISWEFDPVRWRFKLYVGFFATSLFLIAFPLGDIFFPSLRKQVPNPFFCSQNSSMGLQQYNTLFLERSAPD